VLQIADLHTPDTKAYSPDNKWLNPFAPAMTHKRASHLVLSSLLQKKTLDFSHSKFPKWRGAREAMPSGVEMHPPPSKTINPLGEDSPIASDGFHGCQDIPLEVPISVWWNDTQQKDGWPSPRFACKEGKAHNMATPFFEAYPPSIACFARQSKHGFLSLEGPSFPNHFSIDECTRLRNCIWYAEAAE
jgi:hypothetical protein